MPTFTPVDRNKGLTQMLMHECTNLAAVGVAKNNLWRSRATRTKLHVPVLDPVWAFSCLLNQATWRLEAL